MTQNTQREALDRLERFLWAWKPSHPNESFQSAGKDLAILRDALSTLQAPAPTPDTDKVIEGAGDRLQAMLEGLEVENIPLLLTKPPKFFRAIAGEITKAAKRGASRAQPTPGAVSEELRDDIRMIGNAVMPYKSLIPATVKSWERVKPILEAIANGATPSPMREERATDPIHDYIMKASAKDLKEITEAARLDPAAEVAWVKEIVHKRLAERPTLQNMGYAPGEYISNCYRCKKQFTGDKRAVTCLECAEVLLKEKLPAQEGSAPSPAPLDPKYPPGVRVQCPAGCGERITSHYTHDCPKETPEPEPSKGGSQP